MMKTGSKLGICAALVAITLAPLGCQPAPPPASGGAPQAASDVPPAADVDPPVASECVPPAEKPTMHPGSITAAETWTAAGSPLLPYDTTIYSAVKVEPCAEILIAGGKEITIRGGGELVAEGTATKRIHIASQDPATPFTNIRTLSPSTVRLAYTTIEGGGAHPAATPPEYAATLEIGADGTKPTQETIFVDHVTIAGSASNGILLASNAGFAQGSDALVIKGASAHPISIWARSVGGIPVGSYIGNGKDQILLPTTSGNETIDETTTLRDRGVPYLVGHAKSDGDLRVDASSAAGVAATLTIEPGVTMRFKRGGVLRVAVFSSATVARGSLIAVGTPDRPIVFTSDEASPAPGDWLGLRFGQVPTAIDAVDYIRVEHAGGASVSGSGSCPDNDEGNNDAAIRISGWPGRQFITNTKIVGSATNGIDRGWRDDRDKIDFLSTITFTNVALCNQTYPPNAANVCPQPRSAVPCPKG